MDKKLLSVFEEIESRTFNNGISPRTLYEVNQVGSSTCNFPSKVRKGDILHFNITNADVDTKYNGTMLTYTFPSDCEATIYAYGARGGKGNKCTDAQVGKGSITWATFNFKKGDTLLMCVGQAGTDFSGSVSDGTSGAGGGASFVTLKMNNGTGDTYTGSGVGNGWKVKPLLVSAGGNGGRDIGYSSSGTVYHGGGLGGSAPSYSNCAGGGYSTMYSSTNNNSGKSFLTGAQGATYKYTRSSYSVAGFGGGGANNDDGDGGGGGGYYGGLRTASASSYIDTSLGKDYGVGPGGFFGEGYIRIIFKSVKGATLRANVNGTWKTSKEVKVNVNGTWREATQIFTNVNGVWKENV